MFSSSWLIGGLGQVSCSCLAFSWAFLHGGASSAIISVSPEQRGVLTVICLIWCSKPWLENQMMTHNFGLKETGSRRTNEGRTDDTICSTEYKGNRLLWAPSYRYDENIWTLQPSKRTSTFSCSGWIVSFWKKFCMLTFYLFYWILSGMYGLLSCPFKKKMRLC